MVMKEFTSRELMFYNGEDNSQILIAYAGIVYDVTDCPKWQTGLHEQQHFPGLDLSKEIQAAPHNTEVLQHPCVKRVGRLIPG